MRDPKADVDRLYLPRKFGRRGLIKIEATFKTTTIGLDRHNNKNADRFLDIVRDQERVRNATSLHHEAAKFNRELHAPDLEIKLNEPATENARRRKQKAKEQALQQLQRK